MKKILFFLMAIVFAIQGWSQAKLNESFEGTTFPPEDWTAITTSGTNQWSRNTSTPKFGAASAKGAYRSPGHISYLITPKLVVSANDTLKFFAAKSSSGTTNFRVCVSSNYQQNGLASFDTVNPSLSMLGSNMSTTLTQYSVDLSQYAGQEVYIAFQLSDYNGCNIFLDSITGPNLFVPTCPKTSIPTIANITSSSCDISWNELGTATAWTLEYKTASDIWANATTLNLTSTSTTLNNLIPITPYDFRIKSVCISGVDESDWRVSSFKTDCGIIANVKWTEGFESTFETVALPNNSANPRCWINFNGANSTYKWQRSTSTYRTGLASVYMNSSTTATYLHSDWLISPVISLTGNERLNFWTKSASSGANQADLSIYLFNVSTTDITSITDTVSSNPNLISIAYFDSIKYDVFEEKEISLASYSGLYRIAFVRNKVSSKGNLFIDDVKFSPIPSCIRPSNLTTSNVTSSSIDIAWANGSASNTAWKVYYKKPTDATYFVASASTNPYTLSGLSQNTLYNVYVTTDCGTEESEASIQTLSVLTQCGTVTSFPWAEGFEDNWIPAVYPGDKDSPRCWTVVNKGGTLTNSGGIGAFFWTRSTTKRTGNGAAQCTTDYGVTGHNDWLITPLISLTGDERLSFWAQRSTSSTTEPDEISVFISDPNIILDTIGMGEMGNMQGFTQIFNYTLPVGAWKEYEVNLREYTGDRYIAFVRQNTPDGYNLRLDDVLIDSLPPCATPTNLVVSNITTNSVDINWLPGRVTDNSWDIYYKADGDTVYTIQNVTSFPYTLALNPGKYYSLFIKTNCGIEQSDSSLIINFSTLCDVISTFPWNEGFENNWYANSIGNDVSPICWININAGSSQTYKWRKTTTAAYIKTGLGATEMYANNNVGPHSDWLITPIFNLDGNKRIKFWAKANNATYVEDLVIYAYNVTSNQDIDSISDTAQFTIVMPITTIANTGWAQYEVGLQNYVGEYRLAFVRNTTLGYSLGIDDIEILDLPFCPNVLQSSIAVNSTSSVEVNWSTANDDGISGWVIAYSNTTPASFDPSTAQHVVVPVGSQLPISINGLTPGDTYTFSIQYNCGGTWSTYLPITLPLTATTIPFVSDFENAIDNLEWKINNGTCANKWFIGNSAIGAPTTSNALYISKELNGDSLLFSHSAGTVVAYRDIQFNQDLGYTLKFDWRAGGESTWDFIKVIVMDVSDTLAAVSGTSYPAWSSPTYTATNIAYNGTKACLNLNTSLENYSAFIPGELVNNKIKRLAFVWRNDNGGGAQPPAFIDNISLTATNCIAPDTLTATNITPISMDVSWVSQGTPSSWILEYKHIDSTIWASQGVSSVPYTLSGLTPREVYQIRVRSVCGNDTSFVSGTSNYGTACEVISQFPWVESFEGAWFVASGLSNGTKPFCWINFNGGSSTYLWQQSTSVSKTGTSSAYMYSSSTSGNLHSDWFVTPIINLTGNERLNFWAKSGSSGAAQSDLSVYILNVGTTDIAGATDTLSTNPNLVQLINYDSILYANFEEKEIFLTSYIGLYRIAFVKNKTINKGNLYIDDVKISTIPTCLRPTSVAVSNITDTQVDISWTNGTPTDASWYIYYKPVGTTIWDSINVTSPSPYTLLNLTPITTYQYYIRTNCPSLLSEATNVYTFTTLCNIVSTFPYNENFDTYGTASGTFPPCWSRPIMYSGYPSIVSAYSVSSPASLRFQSLPAVPTYAISPQLGSDIHALRVRFMLKAENTTSSGTMTIGVMSSNTDTTTFEVVQVIQPTNTSFNSYEVVFNNTMLSGTNNYIAFRQNSVSSSYYYWLDDVIIDYIPACAKPTNLAISNITPTTADISWTNGNPNDGSWWLYTKLASATDYDSVLITSSSPYTIQNLSPSSTYNYYMKTDCGTELSESTSVYSFTTVCGAMTVPTTLESFVTVLPNICWSRFSGSLPATGNATLTTTTSGWVLNDKVTANNVRVNLYTTSQYYWLVTPSIDLGTASSSNQVEFDLFLTKFNTADTANLSLGYVDKKFAILVSTDDGLTWNASNTLRKWDNIGSVDTLNKLTNVPLHVSIPLVDASNNPYSGIVKIAFYGESTASGQGDNDLHIDNFQVTGQTCNAPTSLTATNITANSADISWIAGGAETSWQIKQGSTGTPTDVTSTTYQATGLTQNTSYNYYVRANCATGVYSAWTMVTFATPVMPTNPTVTTSNISTYTYNTATFSGSYTQGTDVVSAVGFVYKDALATSWTTQTLTSTSSPFTYNASGLIPNTLYKVRAFATTQAGTFYGDTSSFTTLTLNPPTVTTTSVTNVTGTTATFNGTTVQGTESIVARGFEYKTNAQTWTSALDVTATGSTTITANVTGLVNGTTYIVRAYAETATGRTYGSELSFVVGTQVVLGEVSTLGTTNIDTTSATLNGSIVSVGGATSSIEVGFVYSTTTNPVINGANVIKVPVTYTTGMTNYTSNITGLTDTTQYYVKSYITNSAGTAYGQEMTFITRKSGLNDIDVNSMSVQLYPNPATTEATLVIKGITGKAKIMISDVQGRTINTLETVGVNGEASQKLNLSNYAKGIYYIRIQNAKIVTTQKLIVE